MPRTHGRSDRESFKGSLIRETEKAWLFDADDLPPNSDPVWLPKSQCDWHPDEGEAIGDGGWMLIPDWLAREKGLA